MAGITNRVAKLVEDNVRITSTPKYTIGLKLASTNTKRPQTIAAVVIKMGRPVVRSVSINTWMMLSE